MKAHRYLVVVLVLIALFAYATSEAKAAPIVTVTLLDEIPTTLVDGETVTVDILIESSEEFNLAGADVLSYYPAYVNAHAPRAHQATTAVIQLEIIARKPTAGLPNGVTPAQLGVGILYGGSERVEQYFPFELTILEN